MCPPIWAAVARPSKRAMRANGTALGDVDGAGDAGGTDARSYAGAG